LQITRPLQNQSKKRLSLISPAGSEQPCSHVLGDDRDFSLAYFTMSLSPNLKGLVLASILDGKYSFYLKIDQWKCTYRTEKLKYDG